MMYAPIQGSPQQAKHSFYKPKCTHTQFYPQYQTAPQNIQHSLTPSLTRCPYVGSSWSTSGVREGGDLACSRVAYVSSSCFTSFVFCKNTPALTHFHNTHNTSFQEGQANVKILLQYTRGYTHDYLVDQ